jgi:hypothetical protein
MIALYQSLLMLYPPRHRSMFGEEMLGVFGDAQAEAKRKGDWETLTFYLRELRGFLCEAARERVSAWAGDRGWSLPGRRLYMRKERCFPSIAIVCKVIVLMAVLEIIFREEGRLLYGCAFGFAIAWGVGLAVWAVGYAMRRSGVQRLSEVRTWPQAHE